MQIEIWAVVVLAVLIFLDASSLKRQGARIAPVYWVISAGLFGLVAFYFYLMSRTQKYIPQTQKRLMARQAAFESGEDSNEAASTVATTSDDDEASIVDEESESDDSVESDVKDRLREVIFLLSPVPVRARFIEDGKRVSRSWMLCVTQDRIVCQDLWKTISFPIDTRRVPQVQGQSTELVLPGNASAYQIEFPHLADALAFRNAVQEVGREYCDEKLESFGTPEGVALLVPGVADVESALVEELDFRAPTTFQATTGLQLLAAARGADTVANFVLESSGDSQGRLFVATGNPVFALDESQRDRYRTASYNTELMALAKKILISIIPYACLVGVSYFLENHASMSISESLSMSVGKWLVLGLVGLQLFWPTIMAIMMAATRSRLLIRPTGFALLCMPVGLVCCQYLIQVIGLGFGGVSISTTELRIFTILTNAVVCWYFYNLFLRCGKFSSLSKQLLPSSMRRESSSGSYLRYGLVGVSYLWSLVGVGWVVYDSGSLLRYASQPGVSLEFEVEASDRLDRGVKLLDGKTPDLAGAEKTLQEALVAWQILGEKEVSPLRYQVCLVCCLNNLGHIRALQNRNEEAREYFDRALVIVERIGSSKELTEVDKEILDYTRSYLDSFEEQKLSEMMNSKFAESERLRVASMIKLEQGKTGEALALLEQVVSLLRELLPDSSDTNRLEVTRQLALFSLQIAELQIDGKQVELGKRTLQASKDYAAEVLSRKTDPLLEHYMESARVMDQTIEDIEVEDGVQGLLREQKYAEAIEVWLKHIEERDAEIRKGDQQYGAKVLSRHAESLDQLAWFLVEGELEFRDPEKALELSKRACSLNEEHVDFLMTYAFALYRNSQWEECLKAVEKVQSQLGKPDGASILLGALCHHELRAKGKAESELSRGILWLKEMQLRAVEDPQVRMQLEVQRALLESLLDEAIPKIQRKPDA